MFYSVSRNNWIATVSDSPCVPGFNNSLDHGDGGHPVMAWLRTRSVDAAKQPKVTVSFSTEEVIYENY